MSAICAATHRSYWKKSNHRSCTIPCFKAALANIFDANFIFVIKIKICFWVVAFLGPSPPWRYQNQKQPSSLSCQTCKLLFNSPFASNVLLRNVSCWRILLFPTTEAPARSLTFAKTENISADAFSLLNTFPFNNSLFLLVDRGEANVREFECGSTALMRF